MMKATVFISVTFVFVSSSDCDTETDFLRQYLELLFLMALKFPSS